MYKKFMAEAGEIFDKLEIRFHLSINESGDMCKNSIKGREAMTLVMCIRILWWKLVISLTFDKLDIISVLEDMLECYLKKKISFRFQ